MAEIDAAPDAPIDAAPDAPIDAAPDAPIDAAPGAPDAGPQIGAVITADGFHEIRQGETATLVITGARLAGTTAVVLGGVQGVLTSATDAEVRATIEIPHGFDARPLALRLESTNGTATHPDAIASTLYIVTPDAPPGGHGTHESPLRLCDPLVTTVEPDDTLQLAAGSHHCTTQLTLAAGVHIVGAGVDATFLESFGGFFFGRPFVDFDELALTTVSGLTARGTQRTAIFLNDGVGGLSVDGFAVEGDGFGIDVFKGQFRNPNGVNIRNYRYRGTGMAATLEGKATIQDTTIDGCTTGIQVFDGQVTMQRTTITGCDAAVRVLWPGERPQEPSSLEISDSELVGNTLGVQIDSGTATIDRTTIGNAASTLRGWLAYVARRARSSQQLAPTCTTGVLVNNGRARIRDRSKIRCTEFGIRTDRGVSVPIGVDLRQSVELSNSEVVDANIGVYLGGGLDSSGMSARDSLITGRNSAVTVGSNQATADLGQPWAPGGNDLRSDGIAFRDIRLDPEPPFQCSAVGTTFNGRTYPPQLIVGPASQPPDYEVRSNNAELQL